METRPLEITPGDWTPGIAKIAGRDCFVVGLLGTKTIVAYAGNVGAPDENESKDNARLISAAPKLFEALKLYMNMPEFDGTQATSRLRCEARRIAEEAMAKAQGLDVPVILQTPETQNTQKRKITP